MPLTAGTRIGPYEIADVLGAGGMGQVYRARDTKLNRTVAIKSLQAAGATDPERITRFEREAQLLASLNHPHIAAIYGLEQFQGATYLVLEFVDGKTLDALLRESGAMSVNDALPIARQIADAVAAAHERGIIHRDLKPGNVMVTADGPVKVLDFGLSKSLSPDSGHGTRDEANSPTITLGATQAGIILGTAGYMSPEQAKGRAADRRSDVWSFGCLLFEMLAGVRAFDGEDITDTIAAVVRGEPNWKALPATTPPAVRQIIERCLVKDRTQRLADMSVVQYALNEATRDPQVPRVRQVQDSWVPGVRQILVLGAVAALAIVGTAAVMNSGTGVAPGGSTTPLSLMARFPDGVQYSAGAVRPSMALSPDGRTIAFRGVDGKGDFAIYLRSLGQFDAVKLAGSDGGDGPFFSPDGQEIAFLSDFRLRRLPVGGGVPIPITDAPGLRGATWTASGDIVYSPLPAGGLMRVPAHGGTATAVTRLDESKHEKTHRTPIMLPDGKTLVFVAGADDIDTYDAARIVAQSLETGKITELVKGGYAPAFSATGHLLYVRNAALFAVSFDPATLAVGQTPIQVLKDVAAQPSYGTAEYDIASNSTLVYATGGDRSDQFSVWWFDRKGNAEPKPFQEGHIFDIDISPDGRLLSMRKGGANNSLWTYDIERKLSHRVTFRRDVDGSGWSHDSKNLIYLSRQGVLSIAADRSGAESIVFPAAEAQGREFAPGRWSDDGQKMDVTVLRIGQSRDVAVISRSKQVTMIAESRYDEQSMGLTPDGRWVAVISDESGRPELYLRAADGKGAKFSLTDKSVYFSRWARQGRELLIVTDLGLEAVPVSFTPNPVFGTPVLLIENTKVRDGRDLAPTPDGQRFAVLIYKPLPPLSDLRVVTNWTQALTKR